MARTMNKLWFYSLFVITLVFVTNTASAQTPGTATVIRGKVIDKNDKLPIIGASVIEQDKDRRTVNGVSTDLDGNFALRISNPANKIVVSFLGYKSQEFSINNRTTLNVSLESLAHEMEGVVITAQKSVNTGLMDIPDRELTTANVTIKASEVQDMQAASIDEALQGRLPGVDISATSGDPGAGMQIRIRGTSSINASSDPLIVVDGMPYETSIPPDFNFGTADEEGYAALINISPADIESITVLKDAAATAMWGSKAASGVLVINTKRGSLGAPTINYSFKGSAAKMPSPIPMLTGDQYSQLIPEAYMNRTGAPLNTLTVKEFQYDPSEVYWYKNYGNNTDWVKAISQTGWTADHTLSMQGGGEKAKYYTSIGYYDSKGVTKGTALNRMNARLNLDYTVSSRIRFRTDIAYTHSLTDRNYVNSKDSEDRLRSVAYIKMPNMALYEYDEYGNLTPNFFSPASNIQGEYSRTYNPAAMAEYATNQQLNERIIPHFNIKYDIIPERLISSFDVQFDINNTKIKTFLPQNATGRPYTETVVNRASDADIDAFNVVTKSNLIYEPKLGTKDKLQAIFSLQTNDYRYISHEALTSNTASVLLNDPSIDSRTQNADLNLFTRNSQSRSVGALISAQYNREDKYIINVGVRGDGSSKFGPKNRYALFPSVSTRWRVSGERFMEQFEFIDDLSFRASYGHAGTAPRYDYRYFNLYNNFNADYLGMSGVFPANIELSNLKWETIVGKNVGFNLQLFKNRVGLDIDLYHNRTHDLIFNNLQISSIAGYNAVDMNVGTLDNQGWELGLFTTPYRSGNLKVDFNFNIARNVNIIREISEFYPTERGNLDRNGEYKRFLQVNNPFGSFYGYRFKGVYTDKDATIAQDAEGNQILGPNGQPVYMRFNYPKTDYVFQPGDAIYEDINHDGNIDSRDVVYLGNSNPKFTGGFGTTLTYKERFKVQLYFTYRTGYKLINGTDMNATNMHGWDNQSTAVLRRWRNPGDVTDIPRAVYGAAYNWLGSDRYVSDASFLRFRSATFSYSMGNKFLQKTKLGDLRFYVTGDNLLTFTRYLGQDPEVNMRGGDPFAIAIDNSRTPPTRRITLGISTRF